jgi:hypothetical protein
MQDLPRLLMEPRVHYRADNSPDTKYTKLLQVSSNKPQINSYKHNTLYSCDIVEKLKEN